MSIKQNYKKITNNTLLFFTFFSICCSAQEIIKARVINDFNNIPLPLTSIHIKNTSLGVISNTDGIFQIKIPQKYIDRVLVFSFIGFETKEINIKKIIQKKNKDIKLKPVATYLDEIVISSKQYTASEIVDKAFDNYYKNFPDKQFISKGFLRHSERTKTNYKWLVEAAIEMYDLGFGEKSKNIKTNIIEVRKSLDNRELDTTYIYSRYLRKFKGLSFRKSYKKRPALSQLSKSEIQKAISFYDNKKSNPDRLFSMLLRNYKQKFAIFDKKLLKKHTFKIDTILSNGFSDIYKIKITPSKPPAKLNTKLKKSLLPFGWIYIRSNDFAITALDYILVNSEKRNTINLISGSKTHSKFSIKYIEINGRMYPKYISYEKPKILNRFAKIVRELSEKGNNVNPENYYFSKQEVLFTEIITEEDKINKLMVNKHWNNDLFSPRKYNEEFWKDYTILLESKEQLKLILDLEKKVSLKNQFKQE